jgi:hypothetical protein
MTLEEDQLTALLERVVPEPPLELSAAQVMAGSVTATRAGKARRRWVMPTVAGLAVAGAAIARRAGPRPRACRGFRTAAGPLRRQRRPLAIRSGQQRNDPGERPERRSPGSAVSGSRPRGS